MHIVSPNAWIVYIGSNTGDDENKAKDNNNIYRRRYGDDSLKELVNIIFHVDIFKLLKISR